MDTKERNTQRADRADRALEAYMNARDDERDPKGGDADDVRDLITDLLHYVAETGCVPPDEISQLPDSAVRHFQTETTFDAAK